MIIGYIKKKKRINNFFERFKSIEIQNFNNNYIINIYENKNLKNVKKDKIIKKVIKIIKLYKIDTIVFSKEIEKELQNNMIEILLKTNYIVNTLNGKRLMKYMDFEIVSYILEKQELDMKNEEIYILFKNEKKIDFSFKSNLEKLKSSLNNYIHNFKITNIITNDIRDLRKLQEEILEGENILISVSNNKRKALKRAKYILNVNLNKNELEKYQINRNAIIINLEQNVIYNDPKFNGINVNYFELEIPDEYIESFEEIGENFDRVTLYESILLEYSDNIKRSKISNNLDNNRYNNLNEENFKNIVKKRIKDDKVRIKYLIGNNGKISEEELKQMVKNYIINLDKKRKLV